MKIPTTKDLEELNVSGASCEGEQWEPSCLNRKHCLEFWRCSAMQTMLETWEHANPALEWQSCGGHHLINHGGAVQSTMASSSGESEYYALLRSPAMHLE